MNKPKYQIGDRLLNSSNTYVRGVMTTSKGEHRYFLQIFDNSIVLEEWAVNQIIDAAITKQKHQQKSV